MTENIHITDDRTQFGMIDVTGAADVEILVSDDGKTLWINTTVCRLRICQIRGTIYVQLPGESPYTIRGLSLGRALANVLPEAGKFHPAPAVTRDEL